jgi:hypothetical protein
MITSEREQELREAVARGAELLDRRDIIWPERITKKLRMSSCQFCVLGQVSGDYCAGYQAIFGDDSYRSAGAFGFDACAEDGRLEELDLLDTYWLLEIQKRGRG